MGTIRCGILAAVGLILTSVGTASADLNAGLVGHWPLDGNANDASGNGNNGTVNGATLAPDRFGNLDSAYSFDGIDDYIEIQDSDTLALTTSLTLSAWIKATDPVSPHGRTIVAKHGDENASGACKDERSYSLYHKSETFPQGNGEIMFHLSRDGVDGTPLETPSGTVTFGNWQHLVATWDGVSEERNIYVDGILTANDIFAGPLNDTPCSLRIGWYNARADAGHFTGIIDDVRIYNRALAPEEIQQLFDPPPQLVCDGFKPPFDQPLALKKKVKRAIPVKMDLSDADGYIVLGDDLTAPPVINVVFAPANGGDAIDYSDDLLPQGAANEDNIFAFNTVPNYWEYILGTKQFAAEGTYTVTVVSGDTSEYTINGPDGACTQTFERLP